MDLKNLIKTDCLITHAGDYNVDDMLSMAFMSLIFPKASIIRTNSIKSSEEACKNSIVFGIEEMLPKKRSDGTSYSTLGYLVDEYSWTFESDEEKRIFEERIVKHLEKNWDHCENEWSEILMNVAALYMYSPYDPNCSEKEADNNKDETFFEGVGVLKALMSRILKIEMIIG